MQNNFLNRLLRLASSFREEKWIALSLICLLFGSFIVLTSEVHEALSGEAELIGTIDRVTLDFLVKQRTPFFNNLAIDLTALGSEAVLTVVTFFLCAHFFLTRQRILLVHSLLAALGAGGLTWLLKFYFERSRPELSLRLVDVQGFSYPSGHSLSAAAVYFTIAILVCKPIQEMWARLMGWGLFLGLIVLIGTTRIYLGVHFFSDVLAGILIGIAWASLVELLFTHLKTRRQ